MNNEPVNPLQEFVDKIPVAAVVTTFDATEPKILAANALHEKLSGYKNKDVVNLSPRIFKGANTNPEISRLIRTELSNYHFASLPITNHRPDGTSYDIILTICGVVINDTPYYCALKRVV
jgi:PAS domain-containing protein